MRKAYLIHDQNGHNLYPIYGYKTIPFGAAHTYVARIIKNPPKIDVFCAARRNRRRISNLLSFKVQAGWLEQRNGVF